MKRNEVLLEGHHFAKHPGGCWVWMLARTASGYGHVRFHGRMWRAHRLAYALAKGPIPAGLCVCHSCDNPACVNPDHLWLGTHLANRRDAVRKNRQAKGEQQGHARLFRCEVMSAKEAFSMGMASRDIARFYGVSRECVEGIVRGRNWKHVNAEQTPEAGE